MKVRALRVIIKTQRVERTELKQQRQKKATQMGDGKWKRKLGRKKQPME